MNDKSFLNAIFFSFSVPYNELNKLIDYVNGFATASFHYICLRLLISALFFCYQWQLYISALQVRCSFSIDILVHIDIDIAEGSIGNASTRTFYHVYSKHCMPPCHLVHIRKQKHQIKNDAMCENNSAANIYRIASTFHYGN